MPSRPKTLRVATDVGGTFTDLVYSEIDTFGRQIIRIAKTDTTPPNFEQGILDVLAKGDVDIPALSSLAHGTTVVINALTERKGVKTALIATAGFGDVLEIGRGNRPCFFNLFYEKPKCFVPAELRREVAGRMSYRGDELAPLDLSAIPAIVTDFRAAGVQAVAVCLLHSYANPAHERAVVDAVKKEWPTVSIVASHQITREWREYERTSTTVLSAFVQPIAERYLERLEGSLTSRGYRGPLYIMQSNCGVDSLAATKAIPITMVESGPASGMWAAAELGRAIGEPNVLALDIGGTTAKTSLIEDGNVRIKTDYWIERDRQRAGYPIMAPVVDLVEIGNGGGSIASVDEFGKLHVGPRSAGAQPGPASYGKGGLDATTTDANLALGRISSDCFCGGEIVADKAAVDAALTRLGQQLGLPAIEVARGIVRIANNNMINALKLVSLNRGHDPREFALVAFGGGGGMHAAALGAELGCSKVVVPRGASVFSAWGMMMSDLRRDYFITRLIDTDASAPAALAALLEETEAQASGAFKADGIADDRLHSRALIRCRYQNQEHAVEIPLEHVPVISDRRAGTLVPAMGGRGKDGGHKGARPTDPARVDGAAVARLVEDFHVAHEREYSYRLTAPVEIVGLHLVATAEIEKLSFADQPVSGRLLAACRKSDRVVDFSEQGRHTAAIYDATALEPGMVIAGPAILEDPGTTIVIHPGHRATIDRFGNIHIDLGKGAAE